MDSKNKDELRDRRREEALARRMGEALDRLSTREADDCPDADIMAAYQEQTLGDEETAQCEGHFARCARCRKILAVLAASVDAPLAENEIARLGELVAAAGRSPSDVPSRKLTPIRPSRWDWRVRWLAPALGVAAVLAIWFAVRPPWRANGPEPSGILVAQAPKNEMPPISEPREMDRLSKVVPERDQKAVTPGPGNQPSANTQSFNSPRAAPAARRADINNEIGTVSPSANAATTALQKEKKMEIPSDEKTAAAPAAPPPPPIPSPVGQAVSEAPPISKSATGAESGAVTGGNAESRDKQASAPQPATGGIATPQLSPRVAMGARSSQDLRAFKSTAKTSALMKAPSGSTMWRAGRGGSIERSTDGGRTYTAQASPSNEDWLAVAAVSDTVGWLAGQNGAIARTTDGEHWERVDSPPQAADSAAKMPDWIGIAARNAQNATITARDGHRFTTQDGGKTWQVQ